MHSHSKIEVCSDFDNTIIQENIAVQLILHYLLRGKGELFPARVWRALPLVLKRIRRKHLDAYYGIARRIPAEERRAIIARTKINPYWLERIKDLRMDHRARDVEVTIISRNCIDFINAWISMNKELLAAHHIHVKTIIANRALDDEKREFVREHGAFTHVDRAGFGTLQEEGKKRFLTHHSIYLGDAEEELLRNVVREFIRI